jgi:hypothetical protein
MSDELLSFEEAAEVLGIGVEQVRRLVVERRALVPTLVNSSGEQSEPLLDLADFLAGRPVLDPLIDGGADGIPLLMVDAFGAISEISPVFRGDRLVGTRPYEPTGDFLRIERHELDRYRSQAATASGKRERGVATAIMSSSPESLPKGLEPDEIADLFDGILWSRLNWLQRMAAGNIKWLCSPPVVTLKPGRGRAPDGRVRKTLRNPVAIARHLLEKRPGVTPRRLHLAFRRADVGAWQPLWRDLYEEKKTFESGS